MDFLLVDIKNFLKKLETGQLEIEAGQWELHNDISNIKNVIEELKELKEDVEKMRMSSVQQIVMIKGLQDKIDMIKNDCENDDRVSESERSTIYEKPQKRQNEGQAKGYKKRKCHLIRSEEIIEITSQLSNEKTGHESEQEESVSKKECSPQASNETKENGKCSEYDSSRTPYKSRKDLLEEAKGNIRFSRNNNTNGILQRYLNDSAKYLDKRKSISTQMSSKNSKQNNCVNSDNDYTPFWDEYGSRGAVGLREADESTAVTAAAADSSLENVNENSEEDSELEQQDKRVSCSKHRKKFSYKKSNATRHERKHRKSRVVHLCVTCGKGFCSRRKLKEHAAVHKMASRISKGYQCSYCDKICSSPEKLTSHLRDCRIIKRSHFRKKN